MFAHWSASWPVLIGYVAVAGWHLGGLRRLLAEARISGSGPAGTSELRREAALFHLGLLVVALALPGPLGYWPTVYIWARALQTLLLALVAPGLIVLGAPWPAFRRLARPRRDGSAADGSDPVSFWVSRPVVAVVAFNAVVVGWQVPALYDPARANSALALAEHASYLAAGLLLWLQLISSRPVAAPASPMRRVRLLVGTAMVWTVLGMVLAFGNSVLYPVYAGSAHHVMTVLDDQQLAGAVLWMGMLPAAIIVGVALLMQWLDNEESADLSAGLNRLLAPRRGGWPARPVIR